MECLNKTYLGRDIESLRYQFELLDTEGKGYLEADQLIKIHQQVGEWFTINDINIILELGASDGHKITFEDFFFVMTNQKLEWKDFDKYKGPILKPEEINN